MKPIIIYILSTFLIVACGKSTPNSSASPTPYVSDTTVFISTDKAVYKPGDKVFFTIDKALPATARFRCRQLSNLITESVFTGLNWQWVTPNNDFTGYMVDVYNIENGVEKIYGSIAVDVSSDWTYFPRYGYLSAFGLLSNSHMDSVMNSLTRLHINGLQFYDWEFEHQRPLAGSVSNPALSWKDIANRDNYKASIDYYIASAHNRNILTMAYNLCYGALNDASSDGVQDQWYMYKDQGHQTKSAFTLNPPFRSNIYLTNPSNSSWQQYLSAKNNDFYSVYNFDGYHVDQLGDLGVTYDFNGNQLNVASGFSSFLTAMKTSAPNKKLVMNAVNQYGQQASIANSPVDFLYTEVWAPNEGYSDLANIIMNNNLWSNNTKRTVLAAYMDYNLANNYGYFNTPGVLLTDAVIFAFGASHLEMGEHMLCKEYFPNSNLQMKPDLQQSIIRYYDFLTGYENLLRGNGTFYKPNINSSDGKTTVNNWPPQSGSISVIGKDLGTKQVIHLVNFSNASVFDWRDTNGTQTLPNTLSNLSFILSISKPVTNLWMASPDINGGVLQKIAFSQTANSITFTLPSLQYWDMIVVEY